MILGVDHIAVSGRHIDADSDALQLLGLQCRFRHPSLANLPSKRDLMHEYLPYHDIGVFDPEAGIAVELTVHGARVRPGAHFGFSPVVRLNADFPLMDGGTGEYRAVEEATRTVLGGRARWKEYEHFSAPFVDLGKADKLEILGTTHFVSRYDESVRFFQHGLGARLSTAGRHGEHRWQALTFTGPIKQWCATIFLVESPSAQPLQLDSAGWPVLALVSSTIAQDMDCAGETGASQSFTGMLEVNGRAVEVAMLRGPSGELIELLHFPRGKR